MLLMRERVTPWIMCWAAAFNFNWEGLPKDACAGASASDPRPLSPHPQQDLQDYLQATIMRASSPEEAFRRYDELGARHVEVLRRLTKQIQDARIARDNEAIKRAINEYDEALEAYIPGERKGGGGTGRERRRWHREGERVKER